MEEIAERIRVYLAWINKPEFEPCPRCKGKGYHHGFGENGADLDWCLSCGGPGEQPTEPGTWSPDDLLSEALSALQSAEARALREAAEEIDKRTLELAWCDLADWLRARTVADWLRARATEKDSTR